MPRQPRYNIEGIPQHVVQRGNNRQETFFCERDFRRYLDDLKHATSQNECEVHAYVLMSNHVHLLMTPNKPDGIAKAMQSLGRRYVAYVNKAHQRSGTLWEGRYKACLVDSERYLLNCYRYIEMNPVRARGLVEHPRDYPWSSYAANALGQFDDLVSPHQIYLGLGSSPAQRQQTYRSLVGVALDAQSLDDIRTSINRCRVLGSEGFKNAVERVTGRSVRPGRAGRPRKEIESAALD